MPPRVIFLLGLVFCWDQRIWAQTDLPEIYLNPPENGYLPIVIGTSAISVLPLFLLFLLLCHCWCRAKHRATDDETKSQVQYDSSGPGLDFTEDNQCGVSVDIASEGDRQMDTEALPEEDPQDVISVQQHRDSLMGSVDSEFSCTLEESL
ncbi:leukocyte immunoglobulin-like receptor subfamily B member 3 isoform X2 [Phacochoerus africanus]|uniref:leukocyte immunoglobulin-like receptor subfamily B member 3 isoform X2 n=1 Tax=Phacochoerus africanus TaxID=41426 RepID=UPI001FD98CAE|nr:leukocyte immunoglobulin-like receptor subfamily B member 3 isoform X2 [Phacochoerus africanus]